MEQRQRDGGGMPAGSSEDPAHNSAEIIPFMTMFRCVSSAPFGCPVVPDV